MVTLLVQRPAQHVYTRKQYKMAQFAEYSTFHVHIYNTMTMAWIWIFVHAKPYRMNPPTHWSNYNILTEAYRCCYDHFNIYGYVVLSLSESHIPNSQDSRWMSIPSYLKVSNKMASYMYMTMTYFVHLPFVHSSTPSRVYKQPAA